MLKDQTGSGQATAEGRFNIIQEGKLDLDRLATYLTRPPIFEPGEPLFWDDPYISSQMLQAHLDQASDAASRKPETIERSVEWLVKQMGLNSGDWLVDLGCGPGLYSSRFARKGLKVVGIDYSNRSIQYAKQQAQQDNLAIDYKYQNFVEIDYTSKFAASVLIYGDFCTLSDPDRAALLSRLSRALVPGGFFAFDVLTPFYNEHQDYLTGWTAEKEGFWRPVPYLELRQNVKYPDEVYLARHVVIEESGGVTDYRLWNRLFNFEKLRRLLENYGFEVQAIWSDLAGTPYYSTSEWLAVLARKK